jgi:hypothetical protein
MVPGERGIRFFPGKPDPAKQKSNEAMGMSVP